MPNIFGQGCTLFVTLFVFTVEIKKERDNRKCEIEIDKIMVCSCSII